MSILYCRVGWMNSYQGSIEEKPQGGGKYNKDNIGYEVYNYLGYHGEYYGFVEAGINKSIHIERICGDKNAEFAEHILVVWVATKPSGGQYIVGWYKDATVFRNIQTVPAHVMSKRSLNDHNAYNIFSTNTFLIDSDNRNYCIDGMGHSNIWYGNDMEDENVKKYIQNYEINYRNRIELVEKNLDTFLGDEREAVVKLRINQDKFRNGLIRKHKGKCCLCGVTYKPLLVASHIKPWAKSNNFEKLDLENGLLLCPAHDKLFDSGLISFDEKGNIMISSELSKTNRIFLNVDEKMNIDISIDNAKYISYHREKIFKR